MSMVTQNKLKSSIMKNLKKLTRNELKNLNGGKLQAPISSGTECGCVQAGCAGDGSARCGGSCC